MKNLVDLMKEEPNRTQIQRIEPNLFLHANGVYYGRIKSAGKAIQRSLRTTDLETARHNLADFKKLWSGLDDDRPKKNGVSNQSFIQHAQSSFALTAEKTSKT